MWPVPVPAQDGPHLAVYADGVEQKLYRIDFAGLLDVKTDTLNRYKLPPRDGTDIEGGHARPFWWLSTALKWKANRPGRGSPGVPRRRVTQS